jgi:osmotically inducible protein OsmC
LEVTAQVDELAEDEFQGLAETAKIGCPVSQAFEGNVPITLTASLA